MRNRKSIAHDQYSKVEISVKNNGDSLKRARSASHILLGFETDKDKYKKWKRKSRELVRGPKHMTIQKEQNSYHYPEGFVSDVSTDEEDDADEKENARKLEQEAKAQTAMEIKKVVERVKQQLDSEEKRPISVYDTIPVDQRKELIREALETYYPEALEFENYVKGGTKKVMKRSESAILKANREYGRYYLDPKVWNRSFQDGGFKSELERKKIKKQLSRKQKQQFRKYKAQMKDLLGAEMKESEVLDTYSESDTVDNLADLHITGAFKAFLKANKFRLPKFLAKMDIQENFQEQQNKLDKLMQTN